MGRSMANAITKKGLDKNSKKPRGNYPKYPKGNDGLLSSSSHANTASPNPDVCFSDVLSAVDRSHNMLKDPLDVRPYSHSMREQLKQEKCARSFIGRSGQTYANKQSYGLSHTR